MSFQIAHAFFFLRRLSATIGGARWTYNSLCACSASQKVAQNGTKTKTKLKNLIFLNIFDSLFKPVV